MTGVVVPLTTLNGPFAVTFVTVPPKPAAEPTLIQATPFE